MTMEQCFSGGFVNDFMDNPPADQMREISTAARDDQSSYGNDFSFYWIDGMVGAANHASTADGDTRLLSLREGFLYGEAKDPSASLGKETPQYRSTGVTMPPDGDGTAFGLSSCAVCPLPKDILPVCQNCQLPRDVDTANRPKDGIFEDLNGDNQFTTEDVGLFFTNLEWIQATQPACAFDPNGNKRVDLADVVQLYTEVQ